MRALRWCVAAALVAVASAATLRRTPAVEASSRSSRRFTPSDVPEIRELERIDPDNARNDSPKPRSYSRRRDGPAERNYTRTRTRISSQNDRTAYEAPMIAQRKSSQSEAPIAFVEIKKDERNQNSRSRYSRTRKKPIETNEKDDSDVINFEEASTRTPSKSRSRPRKQGRVAPTPSTVEASSPIIDERKIEVISTTLDEISRMSANEDVALNVRSTERAPARSRERGRFTSRDSSTDQKEAVNTTIKRTRGRINSNSRTTTPKVESFDTVSSESINDVTIVFKDSTTARTMNDSRNSRKLRYKTRLTETDTNLTGDGIPVETDAEKGPKNQSGQPTDTLIQNARVTFRPKVTRKPHQTVDSRPESNSDTISTSRNRGSFKSSVSLSKQSKSSEISEDDNYPESFKALLQAKNASPQADSPKSESLSVKASQKVYNTFSPTSTDTNSSNSQRYTRFHPSQNKVEAGKRVDISDEKEIVHNNQQLITKKPFRELDFKNRTSYLSRYRKSSSSPPSSTESTKVVNKNKYKFSRSNKVNVTGTLTGVAEHNKTIENEKSKVVIKKPIYRSNYFSRLRTSTMKPEIVSDVRISTTTSTTINMDSAESVEEINNTEDFEEIPQPLSLTAKYHSSYKDGKTTPDAPRQENSFTPIPAIRNIHSRHSLAKARTVKPEEQIKDVSMFDEGLEDMNSRKYIESYSKSTLPTTNVIPGFEKSKGRFSSKYRAPLDRPVYQPTVPSVKASTAWLKFFVTDSHETDTLSEPTWYLGVDENFIVEDRARVRAGHHTQNHSPATSTEPDEAEENALGPDINIITFNKAQSTPSSADLRLSETVLMPSHLISVETSIHSPSATISIFDALAEILTSTPKMTSSSTTETITENSSIPNVTLNGVSSNQPITLSVSESSSEDKPISFDVTTITKPVQTTIQPVINTINDAARGTYATQAAGTKQKKQVIDLPDTPPSPVLTTPLPMTSRKPFATIILYSTTEPSSTDAITSGSIPTANRPSTTESSSMVFNTVSDLILSNNNLISSTLTGMLSNNIQDILYNMDEKTRSRVSVNMDAILKFISVRSIENVSAVADNVDDITNTTPFSEDDILATEFNETLSEIVNRTRFDDFDTTYSSKTTDGESSMNADALSPVITEKYNKILAAPIVVDSPSFSRNEIPAESTISVTTNSFTSTQQINNYKEPAPSISSKPNDVNINNKPSPMKSRPIPFISNFQIDDDEDELTNADGTSLLTSDITTKTVASSLSPPTLRSIIENINVQDPCLLTPAQFWGLSKKARVLKIIEDIIRQHNIELSTTARPLLPISDVTMSFVRDRTNERLTSHIDVVSTALADFNNDQPMIGDVNDRLGNGALPTTLSSSTLLLTDEMSTTNQPLTSESMTNPSISLTSTEKNSAEISSEISDLITTTSEASMNNTNLFPSAVTMTNDFPEMDLTSILSMPSISLETFSTDTPTDTPILPKTLLSAVSTDTSITDLTSPRSDPTLSEEIQPVESSVESTTSASNSTDLNLLDTTIAPTAILSSTTITMENTTEAMENSSEVENTDTSNIEKEMSTEMSTTVQVVDIQSIDMPTTSTIRLMDKPLSSPPKKDYVIFGILPNNTVVRKNPNEDPLETLTEASPYIVYGVLPNNTIIRKFPNGTRVPRVMQQIDVLPISPWSLRNPYSPIHNNPAIVRPPNLIQQSINMTPSNNTSNIVMEITEKTVNNTEPMISSQALSVNGKGALATPKSMSGGKAAGANTLSHVLSLRTSTMLPSINEILLNSISSATKEEQVIYKPEMTMTSTTMETRILTLDIDPETKLIRTEKPENGMGAGIFKYIPIDEVKVEQKDSNVFKLATPRSSPREDINTPTVREESLSSTTNAAIDQQSTTEISTNERASFATTTEMNTTPIVLIATNPVIQTTTPAITTTARTSTTLRSISTTLSEDISMSTTFLPNMFPPRRVQFRTTTESLLMTDPPVPVTTTQRRKPQLTTTETFDDFGISTTNIPVFTSRTRPPTTTSAPIERTTMRPINQVVTTEFPSARRVQSNRFGISTTDTPSSTYSVQDDIAFLQNLKSVVNSNTDDPEADLANRIIALAVERSLNDLNTNKGSPRTSKKINALGITSNRVPVTTSTTTTTTTTTPRPTTTRPTSTEKSTPSIEEDIRQFQEDTKLLQALLKATGQNPVNFKIPTVSNTNSKVRSNPNQLSNTVDEELKLLGNLLASPSPLNEPFDSLTPKPNTMSIQDNKAETSISLNVKPISRGRFTPTTTLRSTTLSSGNSITPSLKDDLKSFQEDTKLLQTLLQLQGGKVTTTPKNKVAITGLTGDETLATLLAQSNKKVAAATRAPLALSTEYGKSNDALLAALLKEQGFGPSTASSLEEQIKLAALLNQVVVTPKPRRPPPPPPPPPPARRPIIDGLAWLWQQWQDTAPGPGPARGARRPAGSPGSPGSPTAAAAASSPPRVNWFGSGPFVGDAEDAPATSNRVPLEPPGAGAAGAEPGRGQLVSAAINVTRAFSQFLGAAIQGAAKTVQNVIKAGRQAATEVYASGSG